MKIINKYEPNTSVTSDCITEENNCFILEIKYNNSYIGYYFDKKYWTAFKQHETKHKILKKLANSIFNHTKSRKK